jgi:general secretion pathway protein A
MDGAAPIYAAHFGLRGAPFRATPDPRFFYSNPVYREAYANLLYGVLERKGFIALTGEVGTGKTTLLRRLMDELGPPVRFVHFYNTTLTFDETVEFICGELGIPVDGSSRVQRLQRLNDELIAEARRGGNVVLLIDEAQNLGRDVLESLRLISNLETATEKLLQIVLVGQPELDATLADRALRQVAQRIAVRFRLAPLSHAEIGHFIDYRLRQCGGTRREVFTARAVDRVAMYSQGIPRVINTLCDGAMLASYGAGMRRVTGAMIDEAASDLRLSARNGTRRRARFTRGTACHRGRIAAARLLRSAPPSLAAVALAASAVALLPTSPVADVLNGVPARIRDAVRVVLGSSLESPRPAPRPETSADPGNSMSVRARPQ